jgi:hypothetical protein
LGQWSLSANKQVAQQIGSTDFLVAVAAADDFRATLKASRTDKLYAYYEKKAAD